MLSSNLFRQGGRRTMRTIAMPIIRNQAAEGLKKHVSEEELCQDTRYQLPKIEFEKFAKHYHKFNISALVDVAVRAAGNGATTCVELVKSTEDQYYKACLMKMDNGEVVMAKLLSPNLRTVLKLPVPRIQAFSSDINNPIGSEYIIEEKARGEPLMKFWHLWDMPSKIDLVTQLVEFEEKLTSLRFGAHGCIYYQAHLVQKGFYASNYAASSLERQWCVPDDDPVIPSIPSCLEKFTIGPLVEARLWEGEKAGMNLDRGPWYTPLSYMNAMGTNEREWAVAHAKPQINGSRSAVQPVSLDDYISLLDKYLLLVPSLATPFFPASLSHPDLRLDNIFVDPHTEKITCITGWRAASVSEPFFQYSLPHVLTLTTNLSSKCHTDDFRSMDAAIAADLAAHYRNMSRLTNEEHWGMANLHERSLLYGPTALVCGAWSRNDISTFQRTLERVVTRWNDISDTESCPVHFTRHGRESLSDNSELSVAGGNTL